MGEEDMVKEEVRVIQPLNNGKQLWVQVEWVA